MTVGPALADAAERARRLPEVGLGLHLTLVGERPVCRPEEIPSLVGRDGRFLPGYRAFLARYLRGGVRAADVRREFRAQAAALSAFDLRLDHLDSHQHLHLLPGLFSPALALAREHGIAWVRAPRPLGAPREPVTSGTGVIASTPPRALTERLVFHFASMRARHCLRRAGLPVVAGSLGFDCSGRLTAAYLLRHLPALPSGVTELICHPGEEDPETRARYQAWDYHWAQELAALTDPTVGAAMAVAGVRLARFGGDDGMR